MRMLKRYFYFMLGLTAVLMTACSSEETTNTELSMPEGMGRIRITISTPESNPDLTRAVSTDTTWLAPDHEWERLQTFRILICDAATNEVVQIISGDKSQMGDASTSSSEHLYKQSAELVSEPLLAGAYKIYATANFADGYIVGATVDLDRTEKFPNGYGLTTQYGENLPIPMTGQLAGNVTVTPGDVTDAGTITVWRVMGKMQFEFANFTSSKIKIKGIEVEPINQLSTGDDSGKGLVYLFSKDDLTSTANLAAGTGITIPASARTNVGTVRYEPTTPLTLDAKDGTNFTGNLFFYVNETDATFTTTNNQLSVRFKIKRQKAGNEDEWYDEELRYGVTTNHNGTSGGFNVIRRNDWVHIPVYLRDWTFRIEAMPFVPIGGYPAVVVGNDALEATFSTGGYVILQPFAQKNNDGVWRDCSDPEVTFVSLTSTPQPGSGSMMTTPFAYDEDTKCIIGVLNNNLDAGTYRTTLTIDMKLGPQGSQFDYTFTCNVILQK